MLIRFTIQARCVHSGKDYVISVGRHSHTIDRDRDINFEVEHDYRGQDQLDLLSLSGVTAGLRQQVSVIGITRNDMDFGDWRSYCVFEIGDNPYVENKKMDRCFELCFNGTLRLDIKQFREQFERTDYYHSERRDDFVFDNRHLSVNDAHDYWCYRDACGDPVTWDRTHRPSRHHDNQPYLPEYREQRHYRYGTFGCSFTRGTSLARGEEWPALLHRDAPAVINLAEGGLGVDGILLNLARALEEFRMDRVIILFPNLERRILRLFRDPWHLRVPLTVAVMDRDLPPEEDQMYMSRSQWADIKAKFRHDLMSGLLVRRSQRIIAKLVRLLGDRGVPAWYSSWHPDTYRYLQSLDLGSALLPEFPANDHGAPDGHHPSAQAHQRWIHEIYPLIR